MAIDNAKNFAKVTVSTGYDAAATTIVLSASEGAKLPSVPFNAVWFNSTDYTDPTDDPNKEIVRVTNITTDTLTVTRAQESTSAATHNTGGKTYKMIAGLTAKTINTDLPATYLPQSYLDTDGNLAANSDSKIPSQRAAKYYTDLRVNPNTSTLATGIPFYEPTNNGSNKVILWGVNNATADRNIYLPDEDGEILTSGKRSFILNCPQGFLINGKIVPSVSSGNLTVALKTLAGTDPSATDPVYCRIGDTVRTISSALSHTMNSGTNYNNAGSSELATKEIDWFTFLGWSTVDSAVHIGISRWSTDGTVPTAGSTSSKGCNVNGSMNAGDTVEVVCRFAATLSSGAGYTWSVPTFTPINLIQKPIYETRWLSISTVWSGFSVNPTGTFSYKILNDSCLMMYVDSSAGTSNATNLTFNGPMPALSSATMAKVVFGKDNSVNLTTPSHLSTTSGSSVISAFKTFASGVWTGSGTKDIYPGLFSYKF